MNELNKQANDELALSKEQQDEEQIDIEFDRKYKRRRLVVVHHYYAGDDPAIKRMPFTNWYCGYMQVLPEDKDYNLVCKTDETDLDVEWERLYPHASGGVTLVGYIWFDPANQYVGFDTNHFFNRDANRQDCINALKDMVDYDQLKINNFKELGE